MNTQHKSVNQDFEESSIQDGKSIKILGADVD